MQYQASLVTTEKVRKHRLSCLLELCLLHSIADVWMFGVTLWEMMTSSPDRRVDVRCDPVGDDDVLS